MLVVMRQMNARTPNPEAGSMSLIRALKSLLSIVVSSLGALAIGVAAVAVVVFLLLFAVGLWSPSRDFLGT